MGGKVTVTSLAEDGLTSDRLVEQLTSDADATAAIAAADIIVIGAGGADLNAGDDRFAAGTCSAEACYKDDLAAFAQNFDAAAVAIVKARDGKPTLFRAITPPNVLTGAESVIPPFLRPVATRIGVFQAKIHSHIGLLGNAQAPWRLHRRAHCLQRRVRKEQCLQERADESQRLLLPKRQGPTAHGGTTHQDRNHPRRFGLGRQIDRPVRTW
jgi:hypothetical protein